MRLFKLDVVIKIVDPPKLGLFHKNKKYLPCHTHMVENNANIVVSMITAVFWWIWNFKHEKIADEPIITMNRK